MRGTDEWHLGVAQMGGTAGSVAAPAAGSGTRGEGPAREQLSFVQPALPARPRGVLSLLWTALQRRGGRRSAEVLSVALVVAALGLFAYPFGTDVYQRMVQSRLQTQLAGPRYAIDYRLHKIAIGQGLTRLVIPKINLDVLVVQGTTPAALEAGAGHYVNTPLPGQAGNVSIAGHRTTYGHPFNRLNEVGPGDVVELFTPYDEYVYRAVPSFDGQPNPHPVLPTDTAVVAPPPVPSDHWLTLTTCNPKGSAAQRLILRLTLWKTIPLTPTVSR